MNRGADRIAVTAAIAAALALSCAAGEPVTGDAAVAKFPAALQEMGLHTARWMQLTNGVEYYYGRFSSLCGYKNDLHMIRVDYRMAPVRLKFVDNTTTSTPKKTTSAVASEHNALFAINGTFGGGDGNIPQGFTKFAGRVVPNGNGCDDGLAMNDDKTYSFGKDWNETSAAGWSDVITTEAYCLHNGEMTWSSRGNFSLAPYTFVGGTTNDVLWVCVVDGRNDSSQGLSYYETGLLLQKLGCSEGMCFDGGGSTTMVIRKDIMTVPDIASTQATAKGSPNYYKMNFEANFKEIFGMKIGLGERAVVNQLLFVAGPVSSAGGDPVAPVPASLAVCGPVLRIGVHDVSADCWYGLEKTTDLTVPFAVVEGSWVRGSDLAASGGLLEVAMKASEPSAFYRVVVSGVDPDGD